jgi:uncharacterized protein
MIEAQFTSDDLIQMMVQLGENWAIAHAQRLIELVKQISGDLSYDRNVMELAAYLHDWGAFSVYFLRDVEHALRSCQVVESEILPHLCLIADQKAVLLETIELHDYRDTRPTKSNEALLLREADMLDFLGMIGVAREFARGPNNLETCYKQILTRLDGIQSRFTLPRAQEVARDRLERMRTCLGWLLEESFRVL